MKAFVAFRFTGEDPKILEPLLTTVRDALKKAGVDSYCTFFEEDVFKDKQQGPRQIMEHAFSTIDGSDFLFVIQTSDNKSEGMLMEVGYAVAKRIPVVVVSHKDVGYTYVPDMASRSFQFSSNEGLAAKIATLDFDL